jgi:hypothetical protein
MVRPETGLTALRLAHDVPQLMTQIHVARANEPLPAKKDHLTATGPGPGTPVDLGLRHRERATGIEPA